jgi:hypothetical protein
MPGLRGRKMILQKARQAALALSKMAASRPLAGAGKTKNLVWMLAFGQCQDFWRRCNRMFQVPDDGKIPAVIHNPEDGALRRIRAGTWASQRFLVRIHLYVFQPTYHKPTIYKIIPNLGLDCGYISAAPIANPNLVLSIQRFVVGKELTPFCSSTRSFKILSMQPQSSSAIDRP